MALTVEADTPVEGWWSEGALNRIAENLIGNALKFTPAGGTVTVRVENEGDAALFAVEDTGIGMDPEEVEDLFEAFKQASEGRNREYEGVGLGLSIVRRLVEIHDGTITIDSKKGEGTCVQVRLPRTESS